MPTDSSTAPHPTKEQAAADALNFVVMGYDSRDPSVTRSGSLMILHLNAKRDQAYFISFPRDTWVSIPGHGNQQDQCGLWPRRPQAHSVDLGESHRHTDGPRRNGRFPGLCQAHR